MAATPTFEHSFPLFSHHNLTVKPHRRDLFIEWIKGLLAVPFVLTTGRYSKRYPQGGPGRHGGNRAHHAKLPGASAPGTSDVDDARQRYAEIMRYAEDLIADHIMHHHTNATLDGPASRTLQTSLEREVPSIGPFHTHLPLEAAFEYQDRKRFMSSRRCVPPSFNDVRLILNSAQLLAIAESGGLQLATFDGDMTLYADGENLLESNPVIARILALLQQNVRIGIVTAAGYPTAEGYFTRLHGLLDAVATAPQLSPAQRNNILIMGGEANYLFEFCATAPHRLASVPRAQWQPPEMAAWSEADIAALLDTAEATLRERIAALAMPAKVVRKERAVGIVAAAPDVRLVPESLEDTVLAVQRALDDSSGGGGGSAINTPGGAGGLWTTGMYRASAASANRVAFCAFNGGRDVFVDVGDKSWGVRVCQTWFGRRDGLVIREGGTLHVGDQFLSAGANDYKARAVSTTAWIASPEETVDLLDELIELMGKS